VHAAKTLNDHRFAHGLSTAPLASRYREAGGGAVDNPASHVCMVFKYSVLAIEKCQNSPTRYRDDRLFIYSN
jgi:hypothetical protein